MIVTDIDREKGEAASACIGREARFIHQDVGDENRWREVAGQVGSEHGRLDILVNNAGLVEYGSVEDCSLASFRRATNVMVEGVFLGSKHSIPLMAAGGGNGSIINICSMGSHLGFSNIIGYVAAKGAVRSMTKSIAIHCKAKRYRIRCNSIHPGKIHGGLVDEQTTAELADARDNSFDVLPGLAYGSPRDIAELSLYLASDRSRYMTGAELMIDNGYTITPVR